MPQDGYDPDLTSFLLKVLKLGKLNGREIKYLLWRFYYKKTDMQIAKLDDRNVTRQAINKVLRDTFKKIRGENKSLLL